MSAERAQSVWRRTQAALTRTHVRPRRPPAGRLIFELFVERAPAAAENFRVLATGACALLACFARTACAQSSVAHARTLSSGEHGACADSGTPLSYAGSSLARIAPGEALYGGALVTAGGGAAGGANDPAAAAAAAAAAPPDGRHSAYGRFFEPDADSLAHDRAGTGRSGCQHALLCALSRSSLILGVYRFRAGLLSTKALCDAPACAASQARPHACNTRLTLRNTAADAQARACAQFALTLGRVPSRDGGGRCTVFGRLIRGYGLLRHLEALPTRADGAPLSPVRAHTQQKHYAYASV